MLGKKVSHGYNHMKAVYLHGGKTENVPLSEENQKRKALMDELCEEVRQVEAKQAGEEKSRRWHRKDFSLIIGWLKIWQNHIFSPVPPICPENSFNLPHSKRPSFTLNHFLIRV
jgi:hypothetical protein